MSEIDLPVRLREKRKWPHELDRGKAPPKHVLFFGAGASAEEGLPVQSRLLSAMGRYCSRARRKHGLPADWRTVKEFLDKLSPADQPEDRFLEDCLTFLDKAAENGEVIAGYGRKKIIEPRRALLNCIANVIEAGQIDELNRYLPRKEKARRRRPKTPMARLGKLLTEGARNGEDRKFSIISTNWDTTLDAQIREDKFPLVDYCTYTTPWERYYRWDSEGIDDDEPVADVPSVWKRALGEPTVKLLKLHGSLNWLWCPTCNRLYTSTSQNIALLGTAPSMETRRGTPGEDEYIRRYCPECKSYNATKTRAPLLRDVLVTPTMVKKLDMVHLRMVWYNALVEISEASHLVFAGYTASPADFEARYMIAKALSVRSRRPRITIVDVEADTPAKQEAKEKAVRANYRSLVGKKFDLEFYGVNELVSRLKNGEPLSA